MKKIPEYSKYQISEDGCNLVNTYTGHHLKLNKRKNGYLQVSLYNNEGERKTVSVHRLVCTTYHPNPKQLPVVNHKDGNKANNDSSNLEWCTHQDNTIHAFSIGLARGLKGEDNYFCKRSDSEIHQICYDLVTGIRKCDVALKYNMTRARISSLVNGSYRSEVSGQYDFEKIKKNFLSTSTVRWICGELQKGRSAKDIVDLSSNPLINQSVVRKIKRRERQQRISKDYIW